MGRVLDAVAAAALVITVACTASVPPPASSADLVREQSLDLNGYHFSAHLLLDPSYGAQAANAAHYSGLEGVGLGCSWTRTGADVATAQTLFGTPPDLAEVAGYAPLRTGTSGGRISGGFPRSAADDRTETHVVCGIRDDQGAQGIEVIVRFVRDANGRPSVIAASVQPWRRG